MDYLTPSIHGHWEGHDTYQLRNSPSYAQILLDLTDDGKKYVGKLQFIPSKDHDFIYTDEPPKSLIADIHGSWYKNKILRLIWDAKEAPYLLCGVMLLELTHNGEKLMGKFLGYGPENQSIIQGEVVLLKKS